MIDHHEAHLVQYLRQPRHLINVGAHYGLWCDRFRSAESIIAIEAESHNVDILRSRGQSNLVVHHRAGWSESGHLMEFHRRSITIGMQGSLACCDPIGISHLFETVLVETLAVDDLDAECDLFICDVEGAEVDVVAGSLRTVTKHHPVMLVECHSLNNFYVVNQMLGKCGYNTTMIHQPVKEVDDPKWWSEVHLLGVYYR